MELTEDDWINILTWFDISLNSLGDLEFEEQQELREGWLPTILKIQQIKNRGKAVCRE